MRSWHHVGLQEEAFDVANSKVYVALRDEIICQFARVTALEESNETGNILC